MPCISGTEMIVVHLQMHVGSIKENLERIRIGDSPSRSAESTSIPTLASMARTSLSLFAFPVTKTNNNINPCVSKEENHHACCRVEVSMTMQ